MDMVHPDAATYLEQHYHMNRNEPILDEMEAEAARRKFPIIGPLVGQACRLHALSMKARSIFELGSGYGYSTFWFAKAVRENGGGVVHHVVWDNDLSEQAKGYLGRAGYDDIVQFHVSEAVEELKKHDGPFDIIFMDIDKHGYPGAIPIIKQKLRPGGLLLVDNVLWHGKLWDTTNKDKDTEAIRELNRQLFSDPAFASTINPLRDGLAVAVYRG